MFGDSETTGKSEEGSEVYANIKETVMVKKWEDLKKYVIFTSVKDTSGKVVKIHQCSLCEETWNHGKMWRMMAHVESKHFKGALNHTCSVCQQTCSTKHILNMHKKKKHRNKTM